MITESGSIALHKEDQDIILTALALYHEILRDEINQSKVPQARITLYRELGKLVSLRKRLDKDYNDL